MNAENHVNLNAEIFKILAEKGLAGTTMDYLARRLSISKRTLYEIYGSKDDMIRIILKEAYSKYSHQIEKIIRQSNNVMEGAANILLFHQEMMSKLSKEFFEDFDVKYRHLRKDYNDSSRQWGESFKEALDLGIKQGVFRENANYDILLPLFRIQMESLKRMEEVFPPEISIAEAHSEIAFSFLRNIATQKGIAILDGMTSK